MARILAIDYGKKRTGIAVTDPMQLIANGLQTVESAQIFDFLQGYLSRESVETIVVGYPKQLNNEGSEALRYVNPFVQKLVRTFPTVHIELHDERFTSRMAQQTILAAGLRKKQRQDKALVDTVSATILLQSFMEYKSNPH